MASRLKKLPPFAMCGRSPPRVLLAVFNVLPRFHSLTASHLLFLLQYESGSTPLHGIRQQTGVNAPDNTAHRAGLAMLKLCVPLRGK